MIDKMANFESIKCNICEGEDLVKVYNTKDFLTGLDYDFRVVKCKECGLVFLNPRLKDADISYSPPEDPISKDPFDFLRPNRIRLIERFKRSGNILDIGCGYGIFLNDMKKNGWAVYGNETSDIRYDFVEEKLGMDNICKGDLSGCSFKEDFFDIITMWHTLEHMKSPKDTLKNIKRLLDKNGILIIEVPNFSSLQRKVFKGKSYVIDAPRHLYHFTDKTLGMILKKEGLHVIKKDYFVNLRITFIDLKKSLLRYFYPDHDKLYANGKKSNKGIFYRICSICFNVVCLVVSVLLELLGSSSCQRVYCRRAS